MQFIRDLSNFVNYPPSKMVLKDLAIRLLRAFRISYPTRDTFLIPAYTGLGNFVMMTSMILELKKRVPRARIYLLTWPTYGTDQVFDAPVLNEKMGWQVLNRVKNDKLNPSLLNYSTGHDMQTQREPACVVSGKFLLDPEAPTSKKARFFLNLRKWKFETAFIPFDASPAFVWWGFSISGCSSICGHTMEMLGLVMGWTRHVLDIKTPVDICSHESDIHLDLLDAWTSAQHWPVQGPFLKTLNQPRSYVQHVAEKGPGVLAKLGLRDSAYIVVQISAANARTNTPKLWDPKKFYDIIDRFVSDGETIVLPGDANEKPFIEKFVSDMNTNEVINIAGKTTVSEISTVIKHAKLLLVHDSGLMHIGNAHRTPLLALYGPTDWVFTEPKAPSSHILHKNLPCQPCMAKMARDENQAMNDCRNGIQCMRDITVDEVYAACKRILRDSGNTIIKDS